MNDIIEEMMNLIKEVCGDDVDVTVTIQDDCDDE